MPNFIKQVMESTIRLISDIRHEIITSSEDTAIRTIQLAENLINDDSWTTAEDLMSSIKDQIKEIMSILPQEIISINILRHVLKAVREEHDSKFEHKGEEQSLHNMVTAESKKVSGDYSTPLKTLRTSLLDHLAEYKVEVESSMDNIAAQALEHIHSNEIILTLGKSTTVETFLKAAASRTFQVIVVEGAPECDGLEMAKSLGKSKIKTTVVSDAAVFAIMSRVNKVIIDTHTVMANGALCARCGTYTIGRSAKHYSVPVIVLTHLYKLSPKHSFPYEQNPFSMTVNPEKVLPLSMGSLLSEVTVYNPLFDQVPADFVTLYVTHQGGNAPSYLYRLLTELYHPDDYDL